MIVHNDQIPWRDKGLTLLKLVFIMWFKSRFNAKLGLSQHWTIRIKPRNRIWVILYSMEPNIGNTKAKQHLVTTRAYTDNSFVGSWRGALRSGFVIGLLAYDFVFPPNFATTPYRMVHSFTPPLLLHTVSNWSPEIHWWPIYNTTMDMKLNCSTSTLLRTPCCRKLSQEGLPYSFVANKLRISRA